ncbi:MAG: MBL fold metallo-hydrolase [Candidatus Nanohalobium sp.]
MEIRNLAEEASDFTGNIWHFKRNGESVLVDVGTGDSWQEIRKLDEVDKVVITHSHYDHVDNLPKVLEKFDPEIYAYEPANLPVEASKIDSDDLLELGGLEFEVFHTPGHKDDSICLYCSNESILFTGDLIFPEGGFGRTDLDEGDRDLLIESIEKVEGLEVDEMYCGHDPAATEGVEQQIERSLEEARKRESKY